MINNYHITKESKKKKAYQEAKGDVAKLKKQEQEVSEKETDEILRAGQVDLKKARAEIEKIEKETQKDDKSKRDEQLNALDMKKRFRASYKRELAKVLSELLTMLDWVRGWTADVVVTEKGALTIYGKPFQTQDGILLVVRTAKGDVLHRGMLVTSDPALDYAGLYNLTLQTENTMDKQRGLLLDGSGNKGDVSAILGQNGQPITKAAK